MQKVIRRKITKRQKALITQLTLETGKDKGREVICPFCKSQRLIRRGTSKSKNVIKQKYACLNCTKSTVNPLFRSNIKSM